MTAARADAQAIFLAARERSSPEERKAFLDGACGGDLALRAKIEALLEADAAAGSFLEPPTLHPARAAEGSTTAPEQPGVLIGRYKLLQPIGEGGFGTVWMAEQQQPVKRRVALKVIKLGMDTKQVIARFEAERQALAMMEHPNIAKVLDAGATETGRPYFVMELVRGTSIVEYCDTEKLDTRQRLELFIPVCNAIQHAHQKGVIHRDIKPSNVLITMLDGVPSPKVIDFGIAKATSSELTQKTLFTEHHQMIGTPAYMSPEQAEMSGLDVDTRCDVYSLGVLLYELMTGLPPFDTRSLMRAGFAEMIRVIKEVEPRKPSTRLSDAATRHASHGESAGAGEEDEEEDGGTSTARIAEQRRTDVATLSRSLRGDLDWIAMRCLEKDRTRRYGTAQALAEDIRRHLDDLPVEAGPPSTRYRLQKFVHRNRVGVIVGVVMAALLVLGIIGTSAGLLWALDERDRADASADEARAAGEAEASARQDEARAREAAEANAAAARHELTRATEAKTFVVDMLSPIKPQIALGRDTELLREILEKAAARLEAGALTDELVEAEMRMVVGTVLLNVGAHAAADEQYRAAREIRERLLGPEDVATLEALCELGWLRVLAKNAREAEPLLRAAYDGRRTLLGEDHPLTLRAQNFLGNAVTGQRRLAEAEALFRDALERARRALGDEDEQTSRALNNMGLVLIPQWRFEEALPFLRENLELTARKYGAEHPYALQAIATLNFALSGLGTTPEAAVAMEELVERFGRIFGEDHPETLRIASMLLSLKQGLGDPPEEVEALARRTLEGFRRTVGDDHAQTLHALSNLGTALCKELQLEESERCLREAIEGLSRIMGPDAPDVQIPRLVLGVNLVSQGRLDEAEIVFQEAQQSAENGGSTGAPALNSRAMIASGLVTLRIAQGRLEEAETIQRSGLELNREIFGDEHESTYHAMGALGDLLRMQGRPEEAEPLCREAWEGLLELSGAEDHSTGHALHQLLNVLIALGQQGEALPLAYEAVEVARELEPDAPVRLAACLTDLAGVAMLLESESIRAQAVDAAQEACELLRELDSDKPTQVWLIRDATNVLGAALARQALGAEDRGAALEALREAAALLEESATWMLEDPGMPVAVRDRALQAVQRVIEVQDAWNAFEPGAGHDASAAAWRARKASAFGN